MWKMEDDGEAGRFAEIQWRSTKHGRNNNLKSQENRHHGWLACSFSCFCDLLPPLPDLSTRTQQELGATGNFSAPSCVVISMVYQLDIDTSYHNSREVLSTLNTSKNFRVIIVVERIMSAPDIATQMNETMRQSSSVGVGVVVVATSSTDTNSIGRHSTKPKPCGVDRGPRGGIYDPFPLKFHRVLDEIAHEGLDSVVSWVSHGRAFKIHNPSLFVTDVMPRFFSQSKYTSFQRQLNLYGESHISVDIVV